MAAQRAQVASGERAADFVARRGDGQPTRFYGYVGGTPAVIVFSGAGGEPAATAVGALLGDRLGPEIPVHVVATGTVADAATFSDPNGAVHRAYGVPDDGDPVSVVVDPNVRVVTTYAHAEPTADIAAIADAVAAATHAGGDGFAQRQAPVLFVPKALSSGLRGDLIALWERAGAVETGVEASVGQARTETTDRRRKRRRDHTVTDPDLLRTLSTHIGRRVMPELRKAFAYGATRFEGFKIGCYDADDAGFFTAHRDNLSPATAHRAFALTLNLNEDYAGGELRFPEYGLQRYRPAAGEALVFSGAHLHEVLPVERGRRFVLLSFLFGDEQPAG